LPKSFNRLIDKYVNALFKTREVPEETRQELWNVYNKKLSDAVDQGYSPKIDFYDKDLAKSLKENIAAFSAFKEESFKNVLGSLLVDEKGGLRPWNEFKKEAAKVNSAYNERYLKTEYHQTIAAANAAQKWNDIERTKHLYPNLRYLTVGDNRVRDKHRAWHGKVLPIDHPFWVKNFPPNDWGCRCDTERTDDEPTIEKELPRTFDNDKFKNNPGLTGKVFPETVYAAGITGDDFAQIAARGLAWLSKVSKGDLQKYALELFYKLPRKHQFRQIYRGENGGQVLEHWLNNKKAIDYNEIIESSKLFADKGSYVEIMPEVTGQSVLKYHLKVFPDYGLNKNPDFRIDGIYYDLKRVSAIKNIRGNANKAYINQKSRAVIHVDSKVNISEKIMQKRADDIFDIKNVDKEGKHNYQYNEVYFVHKNKLHKFNRP